MDLRAQCSNHFENRRRATYREFESLLLRHRNNRGSCQVEALPSSPRTSCSSPTASPWSSVVSFASMSPCLRSTSPCASGSTVASSCPCSTFAPASREESDQGRGRADRRALGPSDVTTLSGTTKL